MSSISAGVGVRIIKISKVHVTKFNGSIHLVLHTTWSSGELCKIVDLEFFLIISYVQDDKQNEEGNILKCG